jgi:hypothetical protein
MLITSLFTGIAAGTLAAIFMLATGHGLLWAAAAENGSAKVIQGSGVIISLRAA